MFFYSDGSVILAGFSRDTIELKASISTFGQRFFGDWGNYKIYGDTITIETFPANISLLRQARFLQKGIIRNGEIALYQQIDRDNNVNQVDQVITFVKLEVKPDSTANWIRKKKKYNR